MALRSVGIRRKGYSSCLCSSGGRTVDPAPAPRSKGPQHGGAGRLPGCSRIAAWRTQWFPSRVSVAVGGTMGLPSAFLVLAASRLLPASGRSCRKIS